MRMVIDATTMTLTDPRMEILIITDDQFGKTLAAELSAVTWISFDAALPRPWASLFAKTTVADYFAAFGVYRRRVDRTPSVSGASGASGLRSHISGTRASWSRPASMMGDRPSPRKRAKELRPILDAPSYGPGAESPRSASPRPTGPRKWPQGVQPSPGKKVGTIERWIDKGFGFIRPHSGGADVFVHISKIHVERTPGVQRQQLHQLTRWDVEFEMVRGDRGIEARNVSGPRGKPLPADA